MMPRASNLLAAAAIVVATPAFAQLTQPIPEAFMEEMRWRSIGPANMGGRVSDVEGIPSPSKTFYVATAAGGVWKTTNNGITFKSIFNNERVVATGDLAIDPTNHDVVWVGTGEEDSRNSISPGGGIYKSTDGGDTWTMMGLEETQVIARIVVHPRNGDIVYVAALGHIWDSNPERGLYRTTDGGKTWELVKFVSDKAGFVDLVMHPTNPDVLFASSWERQRGPYFLQSGGPGGALWKTTDGGDTWEEVVGNGFPTTMKGRIGLAIATSNPDIMYAIVEAEGEDGGFDNNGLYRSDDGGVNWEKVNSVNTRPFYYSQVRVDPMDPDRVYFSSTPVQVSNDGGKTYGTTTNEVHVDHHAMWIDPNDPDRIIVGNDGGIAITWDKGGNWRYLNSMAVGQFYQVSYNMEYPYRVCGGLQDNGTWCAPSRVSGQISNYHWATISGGDGFVTAQDPEDPRVVYSESQGGSMQRVDMAAGSGTSLTKPSATDEIRALKDSIAVNTTEDREPLAGAAAKVEAWEAEIETLEEKYDMRWNWNTPFLISPHDRMTFYAAGNKVVRSTEQGDNLEIISPDLSYADPEKVKISTETTGGITPDVTGAETFATVVSLDESPLQEGFLFAGTDDGRVWITRNGGDAWIELTDRFDGVPEGTYVSRIEPSKYDVNRFYVTFDNHRRNDFTPYVYVTDDGGEHFRSISSDLPTGKVDFVHVVREDPVNENLLFVGTDVGVYVSTDRGGHWQKFMAGLPTVPVHDLKIHPRDREIIAATHGRSIWIANVQPLQELTDDVLIADGTLFAPTHAVQWGMRDFGGESMAQNNFERPTPNLGATITYYLSKDLEVEEPAEGGRQDQAARPGGGGQGGPGGPGGRNAGPQIDISITDAGGKVVRTLQGSAEAGLHTVTWNFRSDPPPSQPKTPSEVRDSIALAARAEVVIDSLIAAGENEEMVRRMVGGIVSGNRQALGFGRGGGGFGGGQQSRDPEAFQERPGENFGGGGGRGGNFGQIREYARLLFPEQSGGGLGRIFRRGGGGQGEILEPGEYTVTMVINGVERSQIMTVKRTDTFAASGGFGFEDAEWHAFLEWLDERGSPE